MTYRWSALGALAGAVILVSAGLGGVAVFGAARPVLLLWVLGVAGAIIGNRIGTELDRQRR